MRTVSPRTLPLLLVAAALTLGLAACKSGSTPAASSSPTALTVLASPTPTPAASPTPSPTKADKGYLTAAGYGPYKIGLALAKAKSDKLLTKEKSTATCPGWVTGYGTGDYADVALVFFNGELAWLSVDKPAHQTATGAKTGLKLAAVKAMYGTAKELNGPPGEKALSVVSGKNALFFRFSKTGVLQLIEAGVAETLEFRYTEGEGC